MSGRGAAAASRLAPRVLRRCRAGRRDRRAGARAARRARLRPPADRPQRARRPRARAPRRRLRRERGGRPERRRCSSSPRTASRRRCTSGRQRDGCGRSTRPARSSRRCTPRPDGTRPRATRSCSSATTGTRRSTGRSGEAPEATDRRRDGARRGAASEVPDPARVAYVTQTTLSVDETAEIVAALRRRFPDIEGPDEGDICYATTNRQRAVKELAAEVDVAARDRLAEQLELEPARRDGRAAGVAAHLIEDETAIDERWLASARNGRADRRRVGARAARPPCVRLVPRPRRRDRRRGRAGRRGRRLPAAGPGSPDRPCGLSLRLLDVERGAVDPELDRERLRLDPVAVALGEVGVGGRQRDDDPVGQLEAALLAQRVDRVDQVVDPAFAARARRRARGRAPTREAPSEAKAKPSFSASRSTRSSSGAELLARGAHPVALASSQRPPRARAVTLAAGAGRAAARARAGSACSWTRRRSLVEQDDLLDAELVRDLVACAARPFDAP